MYKRIAFITLGIFISTLCFNVGHKIDRLLTVMAVPDWDGQLELIPVELVDFEYGADGDTYDLSSTKSTNGNEFKSMEGQEIKINTENPFNAQWRIISLEKAGETGGLVQEPDCSAEDTVRIDSLQSTVVFYGNGTGEPTLDPIESEIDGTENYWHEDAASDLPKDFYETYLGTHIPDGYWNYIIVSAEGDTLYPYVILWHLSWRLRQLEKRPVLLIEEIDDFY